MRQMFFCALLIVGLALGRVEASAPEPLLDGPLIAATPARHDRILLYDLGAQPVRVRELAFGGGEHHVWGFSPDGCRVLFTIDETGQGLPELYSARLDGADRRSLVIYDELPPNAWGAWEPTWATGPDGAERIAFTIIRDLPDPRIGRVERQTHIAWIAGAGGAPQFYSVTGREFTPTWSPDGGWLAYVSYDERVPGVDVLSTAVPTTEPPPGQRGEELPTVAEADLWVVSADGDTKYGLTNFSVGSVRAPRWSPDSELIGFIYSISTANDMFWMIANQPGAIATQLNTIWHMTLDHTWLPDSSAMLASVRDLQGIAENRLWRIPLVGDADTDATLYPLDERFTHTDFPRFSPDGRYLALRTQYSLAVVDPVSGAAQFLDDERPGNTPPVWSPPGFAGERGCPP